MSPSVKRYDLAVVGGGPGGYVAALRAHQLGMKVVLAEKDRLGGICLNWGCIPSKSLLRDAEIFHLLKNGKNFGFSCNGVRADMKKVVSRSRGVANRLIKGIEYLMKKSDIPVVNGTAQITGHDRVMVTAKSGAGKETLEAERILLATGSRPIVLPNIPLDGERIITSTEAMLMEEIPERLVIIGAGAIGIEFGYYFAAFGSKVTIVELLPRLLPQEDSEITDALKASLGKMGIEFLLNSRVESAKVVKKKEVTVEVKTPSGNKRVIADRVLMSIGVRPNTENLGLEKFGVRINNGFIKVNPTYQTSFPNIFAVGDVIGAPYLAHVASAEGIASVEAMAGEKSAGINYNAIPRCVYCRPQVASVGMTEKEARENGHEVRVGRFPFRANGRALAAGEAEGMVKLVVDRKYGEILGAQILGSEASEQIAELCLAMNLEATAEDLLETVHAHPTLSEAVMEAAGDALGKGIHI